MILADTTIWIDHFRAENPEMRSQLEKRNISIHPFIVAELALGSLRDRVRTLAWLDFLPRVRVAQIREVRDMIEMRSLYSRGIGLTDAHLIASCLIHPSTLLWTYDKRLSDVAQALGIAADIP
ncbi:MAG: type II toxin-antitoxin system VapC family toxin [Terracidiphilus sp.]|jgi:predicted nucleic acid-binding protein